MQAYFPYSQIINEICNHIEQPERRSSYTGPWQVTGNATKDTTRKSLVAISEIYY